MRVFISSTSDDLATYRAAVERVVLDAQWSPVGMEHFAADPRPIVQRCREEVAHCDLVVLIQAWRRGWVPTAAEGGDGSTSITGWEIRAADGDGAAANALKVPVLAFLADDNWPVGLSERDSQGRDWVEKFRAGLNRTAKFFTFETGSLPQFRALVREQLALYRDRALPAAAVAERPRTQIRRVPAEPARLPSEPYPLLGPYDDPRTFAGRDVEVERLVRLVAQPPLILCVHAPSGAGKSSLLLAGLAPRLRGDGYLVSVERAPGDPGLARRLLTDVLTLASADIPADDDARLPASFGALVSTAYDQAGKPVVFVIDQVDDALRSPHTRSQALATLGALLASTAQRIPGGQAFPCKWILSYRHEFHGEVRAWLEDVLAEARALKREGLELLPSDLSDAQKSDDWAVPVFGRVSSGDAAGEVAEQAFSRAILRPLEAQEDGRPRYPYVMDAESAKRIAAVFAALRRERPEAPLVPELQVVLNDLLRRARERPEVGGLPRALDVPEGDELDRQIRHALRVHVEGALNRAFPPGRDEGPARQGRTRALLALRQLADAAGRRAEGMPEADLVKKIGAGGAIVLAKLAAADTRLVVIDTRGRYVLSHDCLAEAVSEVLRNEARRGLSLDQRLIDLQRIVGQKAELFASDPADVSALTLTRGYRELVRVNHEVLLGGSERRVWWTAVEQSHIRRRRRFMAGAAIAAVVMLVAALMGVRAYEQSDRRRLSADLLRALNNNGADFGELVRLSRAHPYVWVDLEGDIDDAFVEAINPDVFLNGLNEGEFAPADVLDVIERSHRVFLPSPQLFGAMSVVLEELWSRSPADPDIQRRVRELGGALRTAFVAARAKGANSAQPPPARPGDDPLNAWIALQGTPSIAAFAMQQHEVTNEEYQRFDPALKFDPFRKRAPVTTVSWYHSAAYAAWLGASLPDEAQWDYAARGTGETGGRRYPWGNDPPAPVLAVYADGRVTAPEPVGSRAQGRTPEGLDDMAGNVWEWCRDRYVAASGPGVRAVPREGEVSIDRVRRGGSFHQNAMQLFAARDHEGPRSELIDTGFRLVSSRVRP